MQNEKNGLTRRTFLGSVAGSAALLASNTIVPRTSAAAQSVANPKVIDYNLNLAPAKWLWYPSERCLPNTFVLFRKELFLSEKPVKAMGWIVGDSRYLLYVNGQRIQFGPAPCDPRWQEADAMDLSASLATGVNVIGSTVLYYGHGDGTWPTGKPGFIFYLELVFPSGRKELVVSDQSWLCQLAASWQPGHYKRWYLRALQEEFDARLYPFGWQEPGYQPDKNWIGAMELNCPADKPALCSTFNDYLSDTYSIPEQSELRKRYIPPMLENHVPVKALVEAYRIAWKRPVKEYFDVLTLNAFVAEKTLISGNNRDGWAFTTDENAIALTFEFTEQIVGFPYFTITAPAGTIVEMMTHEAHQPGGPVLLNTHFNSWTRFVCAEGENYFEAFDYESLRWLQLHIHNTRGSIRVSKIGVRRRQYAWPNLPDVECSDESVQLLLNACVNTLHNSAQETVVDGMGRERQQYSGDGAHQLHCVYTAFGETRLPHRFITTWSQGLTKDGYFMDSWPAYDRLSRISQRQLDLTPWGPIIDHSIGFNFDCYHHYMYTGNLQALAEPYPRLLKFFDYLEKLVGTEGLLPVENIGVPYVWMDTDSYPQQRHKKCAFNLYAAGMLKNAFAPLCRAFGDDKIADSAEDFSGQLLIRTQKTFWSSEHGTFINNLPWIKEDKFIRMDDRSLSTAFLFDLCVNGQADKTLNILADCPKELALSYPANAGWRMWALAKGGRVDKIFADFDTRWKNMASVKLNNTIQESWAISADSGNQWSHCPVAPLFVMYMSIAGIMPVTPGYEQYQIKPQPGQLKKLALSAHTPNGPIVFESDGVTGSRTLGLTTPEKGNGVLIVDKRETLDLPVDHSMQSGKHKAYQLPAGQKITVKLKYT